MGKLKLGMPFPIIRQRWPDPLFPLLQQMQELNNLDQNITNLRAGWMEQIAQGVAQEERNRLAWELHDSIKLDNISTSSSVFILGAALLLVTNAIFFLRLTDRRRYQLKARLGPDWIWFLYVIPALVVLLPGFLLAMLDEVFSAWELVLLLGFGLAYSYYLLCFLLQ